MSATNEKLMQAFKTAYESLNSHQRLAVDTIDGPVLVNAGPGTGKTQILALRIANILLQTDMSPNNILCLTYTDNGAVEMRNRLIKFIGSQAYKIKIHTFHSFANEVIQDNLAYFGRLNLSPISDLEEVELLYALIDTISPDNPLKRFRNDAYYEKDRLKNLFSLMKKEAWNPEFISSKIKQYIKELPAKEGFYYKRKYKQYKAGDPKEANIKEESEKMEMLEAAAHLYPAYNQLMQDKGRYDYYDMILWVLEAFEKDKDFLQTYQEQILFFLVDEFQDTSRSQQLLLQQLINHWDKPDVFVVGDADQSIYSFQDANVENIIAFEKAYKETITTIQLDKNYRSTQKLLDCAHHLIQHNNLRTVSAETEQPLVSANTALQKIARPPFISAYANVMQEAIGVVSQIESLLQDGVTAKEIAIIYRKHVQVEDVKTLLDAKHIPVDVKLKKDVLQIPMVQNLIKILTWIQAEKKIPYSGDEILFELLHFDFFQLSSIDIAKLSVEAFNKNKSDKKITHSIRSILNDLPDVQPDLFTPAADGHSPKEIIAMLENLLKASANVTLQHLVELVIQKAGVLSFVMKNEEKNWLMQVLTTFFNFVKEETRRQPDMDLQGLLLQIDLMQKEKIALPLVKLSNPKNGVHLVSAHSAKGSEFAHVFIIGCNSDKWEAADGRGRKEYKLPDNLVMHHAGADPFEESRRLFYVAITRAKTNLYISYVQKDLKDKELTKSNFIVELAEDNGLEIKEKPVATELLTTYVALQFEEKAQPEIALPEAEFLQTILKKYTLSVTHLNNFLNCHLKFYYQNLIRVPAAKNENMAFGTAIHYALEMLFKKMKNNGNVFPDIAELIKDFTFNMHINREAFTTEQYQRRLAYGEKILPAYYQQYVQHWNKIVKVENRIRGVVVQHVPINGILDKLEFNGKQVNVVDYKTGNYQNARKKLRPPDEKEPNGGDYWRQAVFYKILLDNIPGSDWQTVSTTFDFVEPVKDEYKIEKIEITPADITTVTQQITHTWEKIQQLDFSVGCGKPDCQYCQFVKSNNLAVELHPPETEEELI
ncbi:MAG: ATP-dependent helicase [Chitinophagaceae bacterium]|nr:ATP-dependent helicase [Chitinophagaceae bacterium]